MPQILPKVYDFKFIEKNITKYWEDSKIIETTIQYDPKKPLFSFLEGPPTANAPPGLHHVQSRFFKDLVCRFFYMKGYSVPRKGGWDCHGLPVEVQVEKKLGLTTKKQVVAYGVEKFNKLCKEDVFTFIKDWDKLTRIMAFWIDVKNPYVTLTKDYIESVWWSLKELYTKDLLYEDFKVVPYCPRCETPLSSHEVALGYKDVKDDTITTKFKLRSEDRYVLAWTTTPWTTPSNIGLAVGKDIKYAVVKHQGSEYIIARDAVSRYFNNPVIVGEFPGAQLVGKDYVPLFDYFVGKLEKPAWKIIATDFVNTDEGTGIVHQAPAFGEEDFQACKKADLAFVQPVDESGKFTADVPDFEGQFVKDANPQIIAQLQKDGSIFNVKKYMHSYPFCWRCDSPLIYFAMKSWFVRVTSYKDKLLKNNSTIKWHPDHIKHGRFGDWLANVKDWALSRNKFWGTPLPIWKCDCGMETAIGSIKELEDATKKSLHKLDLHKPYVDNIQIPCECGRKMSRVPQVIDTWYDSGAATFAQLHYPFENRELFKDLFPYSFISESVDQTRGWFYTLHVLGTLLFDSKAYQSVVVGGLVVDKHGDKMSKSKGNTLNPFEVFDTVGVDAVRLQFCSTSPDNTKRFGYELVRENVLPFITTLWNVCVFAKALPSLNVDVDLRVEDNWIISRTNSVVRSLTTHLENNEYHLCYDDIKSFVIDDVSRWYIRLIRDRKDPAVSHTLDYVLIRLTRLIAPFTPYLSEYIYQNIAKGPKKSVHVSSWPVAEKSNEELELSMYKAQSLTQAILSLRDRIQRSLRWSIMEAVVVIRDPSVNLKEFLPLVAVQANIDKITVKSEFGEAKSRLKADYAKLGPDFGADTPLIIAHLAMTSQDMILRKINQTGGFELDLDGKKYLLKKDHFIISTTLPEQYDFAAFSDGAVYIDKTITPEMESIALSRETIRMIQQSRKENQLERSNLINIHIKVGSDLKDKLYPLSKMSEKVSAANIEVSEAVPASAYTLVATHTIAGKKIEIFFQI